MTVTPTADATFDHLGELPRGKLAIQASAGTGKTFALAALATRYIAEGDVPASELLMVTFTRAATNELRAKVRDRLVEAADHLAHRWPEPGDDPLLDQLASHDREGRLRRLRRAITEFDSATITTIHGFATQMRSALGAAAGADPILRLTDDSTELIAEACADTLTCAAVEGYPIGALPTPYALRQATRVAAEQPDLDLVPKTGQSGATEAQQILVELVDRSVRAVAERRRELGTLSFDDVLSQLRDALYSPGGVGAVEALRGRFRVALIDEFQDTDRVQWDIFSKLFDHPGSDTVLVLVGDPKQSIYSFRGADVHTYLKAVGDDHTARRSLVTNWRSDGAMVDGLAALLEGATFGDADIPFVPVTATRAHRDRRLLDAEGSALPALSLRLAIGDEILRHKKNHDLVITASAQEAIDADLVGCIRDLLEHACIPTAGVGDPTRSVRPPDVAVLVDTHAAAARVQAALLDQGVPAVVARGGSVLESSAADQLRWLLEAMGRPSDPRRVRMFALSWFVGWGVEEVASASDAVLVDLQEQLRQWSEMLATHTVADVLTRVWSESGVVPRVLRGPGGDRNVTDLDHVGELLHGATPTGRSGVAGMLSVLDAEPDDDADSEVGSDVAARRIETEAEAVQVMTVWTAKGLEFPIVCLPTSWHPPRNYEPVLYMDPTTGRRTFDLTGGKDWPDASAGESRTSMALAESTGERLRLLYVALTRAAHQTIVWWANADRSNMTALARVLFARNDSGIDPDLFGANQVPIPDDREMVASLRAVVDVAKGAIAVEPVGPQPEQLHRWVDSTQRGDPPPLTVARFDTVPDRSKKRWSFSAIVHEATAATVDPYDPSMSDRGATDEQDDDEPALGDGTDPPAGEATDRDGDGSPVAVATPLCALPAGATFGTLVHSVLESVDFGDGHLDEALGTAIDRELAWRAVDLTPPPWSGRVGEDGRRLLIDGLTDAIGTPLGPLCDDLRLADIAASDRLNEVSFDLRLADSGLPGEVSDIGRLVLDHLSTDHPLEAWAARLAGGDIDLSLAGHLTGSIDLVMRVGAEPGNQRFVVADYKTNALHRQGAPARSTDYHPSRLAAAMAEHDYPLQALLYSVALHRYLRWRLPGYWPASHLGGAVYLFLRGMVGVEADPATDDRNGVFAWAVPPALVVELSDLLDGRMAARPAV